MPLAGSHCEAMPQGSTHLPAQPLHVLGTGTGLCRCCHQQLHISEQSPCPAQVPPQPLLHVEVPVTDLGREKGLS